MKKLTCVIILLGVMGCGQQAWYQPGKNLQEAVRDCEECKYDSLKYGDGQSQEGIFNRGTEVLVQCMRLKGYNYVDISDLQIKTQSVDPITWRIVPMIYYTVAGE